MRKQPHFLRRFAVTAAVALALCAGVSAQAASLVPLGRAVGIQMTTAGVLVADLAEVDTPGGKATPAKDAGLLPGDVICRIDGRDIASSADFLAAVDAVETASADAVKTGGATILSTVAGEDVRAYTVDISRVYHDGGCTRFLITVTDPDLLAATGGIVQGMSGSPILQDGRLIGAVTHVLLADPAKGYGVSIDDMLAASAAQDKAA